MIEKILKEKYRFGIKEKLTGFLLILSILPVILIGFYGYNSARAAIENRVMAHLISIADLKASEIELWLEGRFDDVLHLSIDHDLVRFLSSLDSSKAFDKSFEKEKFSNKALTEELKKVQILHRYKSVTLLDPSGKVIISSDRENIGQVKKDRFIQQVRDKKEFIIDDIFTSTDSELIMRFSAPIFQINPDGKTSNILSGIISVEIKTDDTLMPIISHWPGMGLTGETLLVRRHADQVIFLNELRHKADTALKLTLSIDSTIAKPAIFATDGDEGIIRALDYRGKKVISVFRYIPFMEWGFVAKVDESEAFLQIDLIKEKIKLFVGISIFIIGIITFIFARGILKPILSLEKSTKQIAEGDFSIDLDLTRKDEIGSLARSFNVMSEEIQKSRKDLEDYSHTLEKKVEERTKELSESEEKFKAIAETSPLAIYMSEGKEQRAEYINPAFIKFFGYTMEDVPSATEWWPLAYPDEKYRKKIAEEWQKKIEVAIESKSEIEPIETVVTCRNGSKKNISWGFINIGQQNWAFGLNLTEQKKAEKNLRESEARFKTIYENAPVFINAFDDSGHCVLWNKQCRETFGWTIEEINASANALELIYPDPAVRNEVMKTVTTDPDEHFREWHPLTKDGKTLATLWANFKLSDDLVFNLGHDITEERQAEEEKLKLENRLQQSQKMESIGTLAGGIAHDFNNILAAILGYAEMARDDCQPGSTISKDLDEVLEASNRAKSLVRQILAFSRQDDTERMLLQPASIVKETITMLRPSLPTTIEISQDIDAVTGLVFVDPTQLNQILMNLCTNAFHAMEESGGKLDVSLKEVTLCDEDLVHEPDVTDGTFIQLSIGDSGTGIAPTVKDKIFDPYFTTKETGKGTGMGLSMVHGIVKNYGGFISFYSELGEGTVFHVFLPVVEKEALPENKTNEKIPIGRERILFVDDEEILAKMGKTMLERLGYHVTVRNSSLEALETFQNQPDQFDIVITDQTMPGMTGSDLSRRLLQIRPDIPIILCTGFSTIISEEKAKSMGIKEFALKPLAKKDIAKLIRKALDVA